MRISLLLILFISSISFSQVENDTIKALRTNIDKLESATLKLNAQVNHAYLSINQIEKRISSAIDTLNILKSNLSKANNKYQMIEDSLGYKIRQTGEKANAKFSSVNSNLRKNILYWIIGFLIIAFLSILLFSWLKKQIFKNKIDLLDKMKKMSENILEEQIKIDAQLLKLFDTKMQLQDGCNHPLILKIADEIVRIEKNINRLEGNPKPILKGLERIRDNFAASGYEMIQLLNMEYDDRMNVDVINFFNDDNITKGKRIITKVIRPQVNYKGTLMQKAQVDVSQN